MRLADAGRYVENEGGAKLHRPELFHLLAEQVDWHSRMTAPDWQKLRAEIEAKQVCIVALDLPTYWTLAAPPDEFTGRMFAAVSSMMLDVLAAVARKDYEDRHRRQAECKARAKAAGLYKGPPENKARNAAIAGMLQDGRSWKQIIDATECSRTLLTKIDKGAKPLSKAGAA